MRPPLTPSSAPLNPMTSCRAHLRRHVAWILVALGFSLALLCSSTVSRAQQSDRARDLGRKLLCVCGCKQILTSCNHIGCTYSHGMLKELDDRVARNESDSLVLQAFVQEYSPTVLAEPPARGFNRAAWIMPVVVPLVALYFLGEVVRRWRARTAAMAASAPKISRDLVARARREAGGDADE